MGILDGFNRKEVQNKLDLEIAVTKLQLLAYAMEDGTDKETDLKYWQNLISELNNIELKETKYLRFIQDSYRTIYKLFLKKHCPELLEMEKHFSSIE